MAIFLHPAQEDITLGGILEALADPLRLKIVQSLMDKDGCLSCCQASPCPKIPKSTLSHHFRVLRDAGLIRTSKKGVEHQNTLRLDEINAIFPGLLQTILKFA